MDGAKSGFMPDLVASRTLVKSPPELWSECSEAASLNRHLDRFGEIRITRLEPETAVAWEGENVRGTVRLEPSGWGTRVVLTAQPEPPAPVEGPAAPVGSAVADPAPADEPEPPPETSVSPVVQASGGLWARLLRALRPRSAELAAAASEPVPEVASEPAREEASGGAAEVLEAALDSLGQAHHRPFSRA